MNSQMEELDEQIRTIEGQTEFDINQHLDNMLRQIVRLSKMAQQACVAVLKYLFLVA